MYIICALTKCYRYNTIRLLKSLTISLQVADCAEAHMYVSTAHLSLKIHYVRLLHQSILIICLFCSATPGAMQQVKYPPDPQNETTSHIV